MLPTPVAPPPMNPVPTLLLGVGRVDANHVYIQPVPPTLMLPAPAAPPPMIHIPGLLL